MCGIFGSLGPEPITEHIRERIHQTLHHRGPDARGWSEGNNFGLGFNRLAILDLSPTGDQPMWDRTGRFGLIFNGEIYNFKELKETYLKGEELRGTSDSEVLLYLLISKGIKSLNLLNGMYAFCFLDKETGEYLLVRDRFGIKPLYFTVSKQTVFFASEVKALLQLPETKTQICESSLLDYLGAGYISGQRSIFKNIKRLQPASFISGNLFKEPFIKSQKYWELNTNGEKCKSSYEDALVEFDTLFNDAVKIRLRSDVPLGIFLSGGIDSGLVASYAARNGNIRCFNIIYNDAERDELELADKTAKHVGVDLTSICLSDQSNLDLQELSKFYDEPFADSSAFPSYHICKAGSNKATVFLTGDAGDEAFAGYIRYISRLRE